MAGRDGRRQRFDLDLLDPEDPFEIDNGNKPHLHKHLPQGDHGGYVAVGPEDILDVYLDGDPTFYEGKEVGQADWLMIGSVPGVVILVPLAPPRSGDVRQCRPIGIYKPSVEQRNRYLRGEVDE